MSARPLMLAGILAVAACGAESATSTGTVATTTPGSTAPPTSASTGAPTTTAGSTVAATDLAVATSPPTTGVEPGSAPGRQPVGISIESALLPDDALGDPWEPQWRQFDTFAYDSGPNQTTCEPYWLLESLRGGNGGGHAMWWIDGGNANHYVYRSESASADLAELASLAQDCPQVKWTEGGAFTISAIEVDGGLGFLLDDPDSRQRTWIGLTARDGVMSVIDVPTWPSIDGEEWIDFDGDDLDRLVGVMGAMLAAAPVVPLPPVTTTPSTTSTTTDAIAEPPPPTSTVPTTPVTRSTLPLDDLAELLVEVDDLPAGWTVGEIREYSPSGPDDEFNEACPAGRSIDRIDEWFRWTRSGEDELGVDAEQIIGRATSATEAAEMVRLFGDVAACDLSEAWGAEVDVSGGVVDVAGADVAASLDLTSAEDGFAGELIVLSVGDVVVALSVDTDSGDDIGRSLDVFVAAAVGKLSADG